MLHILKDKVRSAFSLENDRKVSFLNPYSYLVARKNREVFEQLDDVYIDGQLLVRILNFVGFKSVTRYSFDNTSLAPIVFNDCSVNDKSIYIIGSSPENIEQSVSVIKNQYPNLRVVDYRSGYFASDEERQDTFQEIKQINPDVVVIGMGTPLQEKFMVELHQAGWEGASYTCGGFLHQSTKGMDYYPKIFDKLNIRWVYRIYDEPKLISRYFVLYPKAIALFFFDCYQYKRRFKN